MKFSLVNTFLYILLNKTTISNLFSFIILKGKLKGTPKVTFNRIQSKIAESKSNNKTITDVIKVTKEV